MVSDNCRSGRNYEFNANGYKKKGLRYNISLVIRYTFFHGPEIMLYRDLTCNWFLVQ